MSFKDMSRSEILAQKRMDVPPMKYPSLRTSDGILEDNDNPLQGDPRFRALLDEMWEMHCLKGKDYGSDADFLANLRAAERFDTPAFVGALIRANDKMIRLEKTARRVTLVNESAEDSFKDLACYALLALILYREYMEQLNER